MESPEMNLCTYAQIIYEKGGKNIQRGKDSLFIMCCRENFTATIKTMKLEHFLYHIQKINPKWLKTTEMSIIETIKVLKENVGRTVWQKLWLYIYRWGGSVSSGKGNKSKTNGTS